MKKASNSRIARTADGMRRSYDFTGGVRGNYAKQYAAGTNVVVLAPDVAEAFPNARSVNAALRRVLAESPRRKASLSNREHG